MRAAPCDYSQNGADTLTFTQSTEYVNRHTVLTTGDEFVQLSAIALRLREGFKFPLLCIFLGLPTLREIYAGLRGGSM